MTRLIVALDAPTLEASRRLIAQLAPLGVTFKLGMEGFFGFGDALRAELEATGGGYFLDLKLNDIPRTVAAAVRHLVRPGVAILNVTALGGNTMMQAAVEAARERAIDLGIPAPLIYAVTILTSIAPEELNELGLAGGPGENVTRLAALARDAGCDGVICSAHEVRDLKSFFGTEFGALTPGIRPSGAAHGDQARVMTPAQARDAGCDWIVVGRPIYEADDPVAATRAILDEIATAV